MRTQPVHRHEPDRRPRVERTIVGRSSCHGPVGPEAVQPGCPGLMFVSRALRAQQVRGLPSRSP